MYDYENTEIVEQRKELEHISRENSVYLRDSLIRV